MNRNPLYLLDTSVYCQPLKRKPLEAVVERWKTVGDSMCRISVFCEMEVLQGLHTAGSAELFYLFEQVLKDRIASLPFTSEDAAVYAELQAGAISRGNTRPVIDLCIASTALRHRLVLATLNGKDFHGIPGLRVEDWSRPG
jgi:tRNA(fMet)-specific endonuclease VapC